MTPFTKGLHDLGNGIYAYLQPDGSWGWSNAGLITDSGEALLVDTLFDLKLTADMLREMRRATRDAEHIETVVNTHANGDHCYGNQLVEGAAFVASEATALELETVTPAMLKQMVEAADTFGPAGAFFVEAFGPFDFSNIEVPTPTETFSGQQTRSVGNKEVRLIEVGPAHTRGDVLVHVPQDRAIYTGDILFIEGTPILWEGPVGNWVAACDLIESLDVETIVPGHGPLTDKAGVRGVRDYLTFVAAEARTRYDAGMAAQDAAKDIALGNFANWLDSERIAVNVATLYREFGDISAPDNPVELFTQMAALRGRS